ncbi:HAD family hydrolase [uncultured Sphingomonas sp.]|uniref:HAD family hydrolase n=1 Tax=uncultured Sphingomonas sp. TaxID=158754 RepID=UPI0025CF57E1|nr:HAD family hydrolase [uncultured Sphingomonas sp.]
MKTQVRAHEIATLLDDAPADVRILSLDCFDTLLWRNLHAPSDLFADLPFAGGAIEPRLGSEGHARSRMLAAHDRDEVSIEAIYDQFLPGATTAERAAAVTRELDAEARHCFAFAPTVALIRAAKARGLRVIVVSDTYLGEVQLRALIGRAAGNDVAGMIDQIFCSSEHGLSKSQGLFRPVLEALGVDPFAILHVGDNPVADAEAPHALGIRAVHVEQFDPVTHQRLRMEAAAAAMIDPAVRITRPLFQPHRPQVALRVEDDAATMLGHDVLGPIMHAFASWVRDEVRAIADATGRPAKPLFLLRDGYLPQQAFAAAGFGDAAAVSISRFTAAAASFPDEAAIRAYLVDKHKERPDILARQLLLTDGEMRQMGSTNAQFRRAATEPKWVRTITKRSHALAERLVTHVRHEGGIEQGDTIVLVDLGYNGSVQNLVEGLLVEKLGVAVAGRYLLLRERRPSGLDKKGMIDTRHYEGRLTDALSGPIAVVEQLSTVAQGSVVDYHPNGKPIRKAADVKGAQSVTRDAIQAACLRYVREAGAGMHRPPASDDADCRRRHAAAVLARLLYLPMAEEVALLKRFDHDVNLGTKALVKLVNSEASGEQLRRRGLPYISQAVRMYLPGEVQEHGFPLALSLLSVGRFGLDFRHSDFQVGGIDVPVLLASATGQTLTTVQAYPTHDGYYLLTAPAGDGTLALGIQLGAVAEVVQIEELAFYPVAEFSEVTCPPAAVPPSPVFDAMETIAPGLLRCEERGLVFVPPPGMVEDGPLLLAVAFRPVVRRAASAAALSQAA